MYVENRLCGLNMFILLHLYQTSKLQILFLGYPGRAKRIIGLKISKSFFFRGNRKALKRIAYELCEDCAKQNIRYTEVRYSPHLFASNCDDPEFAVSAGGFTPRDAVVAVNEGLEEGMKDFGVRVNTILCCMTHRPGTAINF